MKKPVLSILTVNFGSAEKIKMLWKSLQEHDPGFEWEWIIVDNPTKKRTDAALLEKMFAGEERVHLIKMANNLGYGGGNAEGAKFCYGEFLAILNPDTLVTKGVFEKLLEVLKKEKNAGLVVPVLKTTDNLILENCREFPTFWGLVTRRLGGSQYVVPTPRKGLRDADWAQGSFWVLRRALFEKLGGFDERFFLFLEDTDFCRRVWVDGSRVIQVYEAVAGHSPNRLSGGNIFKALLRKTFWIHLASAIKYFWKWRNESEAVGAHSTLLKGEKV